MKLVIRRTPTGRVQTLRPMPRAALHARCGQGHSLDQCGRCPINWRGRQCRCSGHRERRIATVPMLPAPTRASRRLKVRLGK